jgi:signal transduction histidine kinase
MKLTTAAEEYSSFKLIAACFQSNLPFRVKTDCICRMLALRYDMGVVSILQYDGLRDKLINKGNFINTACLTASGKFADQQFAIMHLLQYISFYDFLYYKYYRSGIPAELTTEQIRSLLREFREPDKIPFNYLFDPRLLTPAFVKQCHINSILLATDGQMRNGYYQEKEGSFYHTYKKLLTNQEQYEIGLDVNNYSGRIFQMVMDGMKPMPDIHRPFVFRDEVYERADIPFQMQGQHKKFRNGLHEHCGLELTDGLTYCGIPLWSNNRCIGVIRTLLSPAAFDLFSNNQERIKSLRHASETLANFLDQSYAQEYVDEIVHDWGNESREAHSLTVFRNQYCSTIRRALNASGTVLRLSEQPGSAPSIAGKSTDSLYFSRFVEEMLEEQPYDGFIKGLQFNTTLSQCFSSTHAQDGLSVDDRYRLIGVQLDLKSPPFAVKYYYCYATEPGKPCNETVMETTDDFIFKPGQQPDFNDIFHQETLAALQKIEVVEEDGMLRARSIRYVLIMDIPALDVDGIFTVAATTNRPFSLTDIRFAYGEMKRFGLNVSSIRKERINNYQTLAETNFHDLKNITNIGIALIKQVQHLAASQQLTCQKELCTINDILQLIKAKIVAFQRAASFNLRTVISERQHKKWSMDKSITMQCQMLSTVADPYKGTKIWLRKDLKNIPNTRLNQEVFDLCLFNLLENAVKYSYGKESKKRVPGYRRLDETSRGHVHVQVLEEGNDIVIHIANWGCPIPDTSVVFQKLERSPEVDFFLRQENSRVVYTGDNYSYVVALWQLGTNNGLYSVNKYITAIGGSCTCEAQDDYTCFTLKIPKEKEDDNTCK